MRFCDTVELADVEESKRYVPDSVFWIVLFYVK
jgi:hypothetical protein